MREVDATQNTVRQPPQLRLRKEQKLKATGGRILVIWIFPLLILYTNTENKFFSVMARLE